MQNDKWTFVLVKDNQEPQRFEPRGYVTGEYDGKVCRVLDVPDCVDAESEARGRLAAAAPEMLAALKALFEHCAMVHKHWGEGCNRKEAAEAIKLGWEAIAKAEGEL